jgi:hypothetical protein
LSDLDNAPANIATFVNEGGSLDLLQSSLKAAGLSPPGNPGLVSSDFTGDGYKDLAITLLNPSPEKVIPPGYLFIYQCQTNRFELVHTTPDQADWSAPLIEAQEDFDKDGSVDLLIRRQSCGAHTCFDKLQVLIWNGREFENRLEGSSEDMPSPDLEIRRHPMEIVVTAQGINSVGAGPFRPYERHWEWDEHSNTFIPSPDVLLPSNYRVHVLHDADKAAQEGNYFLALDLYRRVIMDETLHDWVDPPNERLVLDAYALFKQMLILIAAEDFQSAEAVLTEMRKEISPDSRASSYLELAELTWDESQSQNLVALCKTIRSFAANHEAEVLSPLYFGYANPSYGPEDICPWED